MGTHIDMETVSGCFGEDIRAIAQQMHMHPELGLMEHETTVLIRNHMKRLGIEEIDIGLPTGGVFLLRGGNGPSIGLRADIDALSQNEKSDRPDCSKVDGVMHACGHDAHTAGLVGAAMLLAQRREALRGDVVFLFQPAEETLRGANLLIEHGLFSRAKIDMLFGLHNAPQLMIGTVGVREGHLMAAKDLYKARITGRGGHSSAPHRNIDPVIAACAAVQGVHSIISRNVDPLQSAVISVGYLCGGNPEDMIVDDAVFSGSIRSHAPETRKTVLERLGQVVSGTAEAYGCTSELELFSSSPAVDNPSALVPIARRAAQSIVGEENVVVPDLNMASEDFALLAQHAPAFFYFLGSGTPGKENHPWHHPQFAAHPDTPLYGAALLAQSVLCAQGC